jgi:hypothetical protein
VLQTGQEVAIKRVRLNVSEVRSLSGHPNWPLQALHVGASVCRPVALRQSALFCYMVLAEAAVAADVLNLDASASMHQEILASSAPPTARGSTCRAST